MKKFIKKLIKENRGGSELTQSFLLIGVAISLVLCIFFPKIKDTMGSATDLLDDWLITTASNVFDIK